MQQSLLESEAAALEELEKQYAATLKDIDEKVKLFQADIDALDQALLDGGLDDDARALLQSQKRSRIYQRNYQKALQGQISGILDKMHGDNYTTIKEYLDACYETGFVGTMYDIAGQGVPLIIPVDQAAAVKATLTDSKVSGGLYAALGVSVYALKKSISQEISRGIASSLSYADIARNISNATGAPLSRVKTIVRTEGHRIQQASTRDAQRAAKKKGADVLKQWDAALDGRTRPSHAAIDGEIREIEEAFSNGLMYPGDPSGPAAEVINCRCTADTRVRGWLDTDDLDRLKDRAAFFGIDKSDQFDEFREKYLGVVDEERDSLNRIGLQFFAITPGANSRKAAEFREALKSGEINLNLRREKQNEHIAGTKERAIREQRERENGKYSTFFYESTDVASLIAELFGTGKIVYDSEAAMFPVEFITLEKPVGMAYNYGTGKYVAVSRIAIQYGKKGVHVYPVKDW